MTSLTGPARAQLEAEISKLAGTGKDAGSFASGMRRNVRTWEERFERDRTGAMWLMLDAYVARVTVTEHPGDVFFAEKMAFARECCQRLLRESGDDYARQDPHRTRLVLQLLGRSLA